MVFSFFASQQEWPDLMAYVFEGQDVRGAIRLYDPVELIALDSVLKFQELELRRIVGLNLTIDASLHLPIEEINRMQSLLGYISVSVPKIYGTFVDECTFSCFGNRIENSPVDDLKYIKKRLMPYLQSGFVGCNEERIYPGFHYTREALKMYDDGLSLQPGGRRLDTRLVPWSRFHSVFPDGQPKYKVKDPREAPWMSDVRR